MEGGYRFPGHFPTVIPEDTDLILIIQKGLMRLAKFNDIGDGDLRTEIRNAREGEVTLLDNITKIRNLIAILQNNYTKDEIDQKFTNLIGGAPGLLDTLYELSAALGNNPNFSTTILDALAKKVDKAEGESLVNSAEWENIKLVVETVKNALSSISINNDLYTTTNIGNNYSVPIPNLTTLTDGYSLRIKFNVASTGAITVNPSTLGAKAVVDYFGSPVTNVRKDLIANLVYDATNSNFQLLGKGGGGDLVAADLLYGKKATGNNGLVVGTMINNAAVTANLINNNQEYTIPAGFHNGLGKIKAVITNLVAGVIKAGTTVGGLVGTFTSDATATASEILSGETAYVNAVKVAGSMANNAAVSSTLINNNQEYTIPAGFHNGLGKIKSVITNLVAGVIKAGTTVGGIVGTFTSDATATAAQIISGASAYVNGIKIIGTLVVPNCAIGSITSSAGQVDFGGQSHCCVDITGFNFTPKIAVLVDPANTQEKLSTVFVLDHFLIFPGSTYGASVNIAGNAIVTTGRLKMPANQGSKNYNYYIFG